MKFVTFRDFRDRAAAVRKARDAENEIVVTDNGRPFAILAKVDEESFEDRLAALRRTRGPALLEEIWADAKAQGVDKMTMQEIDEEIAQARRERRSAESDLTKGLPGV